VQEAVHLVVVHLILAILQAHLPVEVGVEVEMEDPEVPEVLV
jgi:hypothetical protein